MIDCEPTPLSEAALATFGIGANSDRDHWSRLVKLTSSVRLATYIDFPDEGHRFARPLNDIAFNAVTENFLARCLGSRAEGFGETLKTSTVLVRHGAEFAPGLKEALAVK